MAAFMLPADKVKVHVTYMGGGFGRRGEADFVMDAVETSKAVGKPVKVVWTREDDMQHDYYRPVSYARMWGAVDANGKPTVFMQRLAVADEAHRRPAAQRRRLHLAGRRRQPALRDPERAHRVQGDRPGHPVRLLALGGRVVPGLRRRAFIDELATTAERIRISSGAIC
jgi:isoquinoline 1-oxidoreductase beta subunit